MQRLALEFGMIGRQIETARILAYADSQEWNRWPWQIGDIASATDRYIELDNQLTRLRNLYNELGLNHVYLEGSLQDETPIDGEGFHVAIGIAGQLLSGWAGPTATGDEIMLFQFGGGRISRSLAPKLYVSNGVPGAMFNSAKRLTARQRSLLGELQSSGSETVVAKKAVSMNDLRNLTLHTGDEFAMLTRSGERLIIRGAGGAIPTLNTTSASAWSARGWRFSGHTHTPGFQAFGSPGDKAVLRAFGQRQSAVWGTRWGSSPGRYFADLLDEIHFNLGLFK